MPKQTKIASPNSPWDSEVRLLVWLATCVSVMSFLAYFQRGDVLLYGDAVAHMNIARRVFDSKTPGLLQLGTVWLPLPHLLMIPFLLSHEMWQRGVGGSIPSMIAYVFGVVGIFRLVRGTLSRTRAEPDAAAPRVWPHGQRHSCTRRIRISSTCRPPPWAKLSILHSSSGQSSISANTYAVIRRPSTSAAFVWQRLA